MMDQMRRADVMGRMGGDEFLALLPETPPEDAKKLGQRLVDTVRNYSLELGPGQTVDFVSVSIGVAAFPDDGETMKDVLAAADRAVYHSKRLGGGTVTVYGDFEGAENSTLTGNGEEEEPRHPPERHRHF